MMVVIVQAIALFAIASAGTYQVIQLLMMLGAIGELRRQRRVPPVVVEEIAADFTHMPGISVLVPAFNEGRGIVATVRSLLASTYERLEVLVINDGSTDDTFPELLRAFGLQQAPSDIDGRLPTQRVRSFWSSSTDPRLHVLDKRNGGKADALNAGINASRCPLVLAVDADVAVDPKALLQLAMPFAIDDGTVACAGMIRPMNGCARADGGGLVARLPKHLIEQFQLLEYLRAYSLGRLFFERFNAHVIISGAFGLFAKHVLVAVGGYQPHAIGEDMEVVVRIHKRLIPAGVHYRVRYVADATCYTQTPFTIGDLGRQRTRWHHGLLSTLRLHRDMIGRKRFGGVGLLSMPYYVVELIAPVVEATCWFVTPILLAAGLLAWWQVGAFFAVSTFLAFITSVAAVEIDAWAFGTFRRPHDRFRLWGLSVAEYFGYRQLMVLFKLRAFYRYYRSLNLSARWRSPTRLKATPGTQPVDGAA